MTARRTYSIVALALVAVLIAGFSSCRSPLGGEFGDGETGSIRILLPSSGGAAGAKGVLQDLVGSVALWRVTGYGPRSATTYQELTADNGALTVTLLIGEWELTITGLDADGSEVMSSEMNVTVKPTDTPKPTVFTMAWSDKALVARLSFDEAIKDDKGRVTVTPGNHSHQDPQVVASSSTIPSLDGSSVLRAKDVVPATYGSFVDLSVVDLGSAYSVSLWVRPDVTADTEQVMVTNRGERTEAFPGFELYSINENIYLSCSDGIAPKGTSIDGYLDAAWNHVVVTVDNASKKALIYLNGVASSSCPAWTGTIPGDLALRLAAAMSNSAFYGGSLDDVRIYSGALGADDVAAIYADGYFSGGRGTGAAPYLVETPMDLYNVRYFLGSHFKQTADIDLGTRAETNPWTPIGTNFATPFAGVYTVDGSHAISNLVLDAEAAHNGLFGYADGATFKDISIQSVTGTATSYAGALVGYATATDIANVNVQTISLSMSGDNVGGLIGFAINGTSVADCSVAGGTLTSSSGASTVVGGFVGQVDVYARFSGCTAAVTLSGSSRVGGFVGSVAVTSGATQSATFTDCEASGSVTGSSNYVGGFVGNATGYDGDHVVAFSGCRASGNVTQTGTSSIDSGGFVGIAYYYTDFSDCSASGTMSAGGSSTVGGFVGAAQGGAYTNGIKLTRCHATGKVSGTDMKYGGFAGSIAGSILSSVVVTECYYAYSDAGTPAVSGNDRMLGGFVGSISGGSITDSYARGNVEATATAGISAVGGFAGYVDATSAVASISRCYSASALTKGTGAFIGEVNSAFTAGSTNFWHVALTTLVNPTSPAVTGPSGTSLTSGSALSGWSTSVWRFATGSYPVLVNNL